MRTLTPTLLAAQQAPSRTPYIKVEARNDPLGVVNLVWERLYSGAEADGHLALTVAGDGSLIRLRISSAAESRRVYRQRVPNPGAGSDFSSWTYLNVYGAANAAVCALGSEVCLIWVKSDGEIDCLKSIDYGATWGALEYPGYAPTGAVGGMSAAYRPNGDLFVFFTDGSDLHLIKRLSGVWQSRSAWNKTTGSLSGAAVVYDGDWKLLVSGQDSDYNHRLWSLIYGDGGEVSAGSWSSLQTVMTAPSDAGYEFGPVFMDKPDILRCFCNEKYSGDEAYNRPLRANAIPGATYLENLWTEPQPFNFLNSGGLALAHNDEYAWLSCANGVWRAPLQPQSLDLSADILTIKYTGLADSGKATIELQNNLGQYAAPGAGSLSILDHGCRLDVSPGYRTAGGNEYSDGLSFILQGYEHASAGGKASLNLYASDAWEELSGWKARYPLRWNLAGDEASLKDILAFMLARAGLKLQILSQSAVISTFYPDFTIQAGEDGQSVVNKLLSRVPDTLFLEGRLAYLVCPLASDASVYSYDSQAGTPVLPVKHAILEGRYRTDRQAINRVQVNGWDPDSLHYGAGAHTITTDSFTWTELAKGNERLQTLEDPNLKTDALAQERGETILRQHATAAISGMIRAPVNCGQQFLDMIDITDPRAGLTAVKKRVAGIALSYLPARGIYEQIIYLGGP